MAFCGERAERGILADVADISKYFAASTVLLAGAPICCGKQANDAAMRVRICSWNVRWGRGRDGRADAACTADEPKSFDAAVLCLQEVAINPLGLPGKPAGDQAAGFVPEPACFDFCFVSANLAASLVGMTVDGACVASIHQAVMLELDFLDGK